MTTFGPSNEVDRLRFLAKLLEGADAYQTGDALARATGLAAGFRFRANELAGWELVERSPATVLGGRIDQLEEQVARLDRHLDDVLELIRGLVRHLERRGR